MRVTALLEIKCGLSEMLICSQQGCAGQRDPDCMTSQLDLMLQPHPITVFFFLEAVSLSHILRALDVVPMTDDSTTTIG